MTRPDHHDARSTDPESDAHTGLADGSTDAANDEAPVTALTLRDPLPDVVEDAAGLARVCEAVAAGTGPVALDAERASGYRYSSRAYLVQLRREGAGSVLIDPIGFDDLAPLAEAIGDAEWILHAASQDLPCLRELGLRPTSLFDTELAARLLGYPRVGLATLVETVLGRSLAKEHSAVDWSKRPLPRPWLEYAALDVEVLTELRDILDAQLTESDKQRWAQEEFSHLIDFEPAPRVDPWRRTSGIHKLKGRRAVAAVRELWLERDAVASERDTAQGRLLPDSALIAAADTLPTQRQALLSTPGFHGRGARRFSERWLAALRRAKALPEADLPPASLRSDGPPQMRAWAERDPVAAARLSAARRRMAAISEDRQVPVENLLTPDYLRRVIWKPPATEGDVRGAVGDALRGLGAREWQIDLTAPVIAEAIEHPEFPAPPAAAEPDHAPAADGSAG